MMSADNTARFLVGIAAFAEDPGPVTFAQFLADSGYGPGSSIGVHVIEDSNRLSLTGHGTLDHVRTQARVRLDERVASQGAANAFVRLEVMEGNDAHTELLRAVGASPHAVALVVGRRAGARESAFVRLGRTTRRLLRELPIPTFVVPPDLERAQLGDGPIVAAVDPTDPSLEILSFAREMSERLGRPLCLAHVIRDQWQALATQFDPTAMVDIGHKHSGIDRSAMDAWIMRNGLLQTDVVIEEGPVINQLVDIAQRKHACMLLCGSRRLSALERIFASSHASELAARCTVPVGVVVTPMTREVEA